MPHSVGTPERRCQISTDTDDNAIDLVFLTETRFRSHGMKPRSAIWRQVVTPSSHWFKPNLFIHSNGKLSEQVQETQKQYVKSFLRPSRGSEVAVIFRTSRASSRLTVESDFAFTHNTCDFYHIRYSRVFHTTAECFTLQQSVLRFFCVYRPPPNHRAKYSMFLELLPEFLNSCNSLILSDVNIHYDRPCDLSLLAL